MDPFTELLNRYRDQLPIGSGRGWSGCTCVCHKPNSGVIHIQACCQPSHQEIQELIEQFRDDPQALALIRQCALQALRGLSAGDLSRFLGR